MTYQLHPLCTLFPRMDGAEFDALCADIKANGLRQRIVLHQGMILDGGNRYRACQVAGVDPLFDEFEGDNIVSFVLSANLHRRHMSAGQQAAIVSSATDWAKAQTHGGNRKKDQAGAPPLETVKQRAAVSGANERTQRDADKLVRENPEKAKEVAQGKTSLHKAVKESKPAKKTAAELEREQAAEDAYGDTDPLEMLEMLESMQKQIEELTALVSAAEADDLKAEAIKWRRISEAAQRGQSDYMDRLQKEKKDHEKTYRWLARCGKAVGESDPEKIAATVEAFARQHKQVAA